MAMQAAARPVHPHIRGVYGKTYCGIVRVHRSIPTYVGFTLWIRSARLCFSGPSPHTWGLLIDLIYQLLHVRSIPTYVGFTSSESRVTKIPSVHPHIRGVYCKIEGQIADHSGPSPHTWGLLNERPDLLIRWRSIPTYVGFTR